jgi:hypothetical protein
MGCEIAMWGPGKLLAFDNRIQESYKPQPCAT